MIGIGGFIMGIFMAVTCIRDALKRYREYTKDFDGVDLDVKAINALHKKLKL